MPEPGEIISATVDRISKSGNGMVKLDEDEELNLGPMKQSAVGDEVNIEILSGEFDRCLTSSAVSNDYYEIIGLRSSDSPVTVTVDRITESSYGIVELEQEYLNVGPITCSAGETVDIEFLQKGYAECSNINLRKETYEDWIELVTRDTDRFVLPVIINDISEDGDSLSNIGDFSVNVGPLNCRPGDIVDVEIVKSPKYMDYTLGYSLNTELHGEGYEERMQTLLREFVFEILGSTGSDNVVEGTIDRISGQYKSSDGIVEYKGREYNIGPIREEAVGETVEVIILGNNSAACLNRNAWGKDKFGRSNIAWIVRQAEGAAHTSNEVRNVSGFVGVRKPSFNGYSDEGEEEAEDTNDTSSRLSTREDDKEKEIRPSLNPTHKSQTRAESSSVYPVDKSVYDLAKLRAQAEQAASEDPERSEETSPGSQYIRSPEIKAYAKTRADGYCEGCGNQSPFISKQGEPYLEVHHVDELGEGGSDTPDTVIALCPTCHSRIHYGEDGDEYNQELREKVENELADIGR